MKIQRTTLALVLLALGLAGGIYIQQRTAADSPRSVRSEGAASLFDFEEEDVVRFTITHPGLTLSLEKQQLESTGDDVADLIAETAALGQPNWAITAPEQTPASDGAVAFLLNLLATGDRREEFQLSNSEGSESASGSPTSDSLASGSSETNLESRLAEFGLASPQAQVEVTLANGETHRLFLGSSNFDESGLYATTQIGDRASSSPIEIFLVDSSLAPALLRPLEEWRYTAELPEGELLDVEQSATGEAESAPEAEAAEAVETEFDPLSGELEQSGGEGQSDEADVLQDADSSQERQLE